jgi:hypothetical protein
MEKLKLRSVRCQGGAGLASAHSCDSNDAARPAQELQS